MIYITKVVEKFIAVWIEIEIFIVNYQFIFVSGM